MQTGGAATLMLTHLQNIHSNGLEGICGERREEGREERMFPGNKSCYHGKTVEISKSVASIGLMRLCLIEAIIYHFGVET